MTNRLPPGIRYSTANINKAKPANNAASGNLEFSQAPSGAPTSPDGPKMTAVRNSASPVRSRAKPPPRAVAPTAASEMTTA